MGNKESSPLYENRGKGDVVSNPIAEPERTTMPGGSGTYATKASTQALLAAANSSASDPSPPDDSLAGARRVYIQRGPDGYGFLFSTNSSGGLGLQQGMNHFISRVDPSSPADASGLHLGDRIIKVNDAPITNMLHRNVVRLIQESPPSAPLRLLVCAPSRLNTNTLRINGATGDGASLISDDLSLRSHNVGRSVSVSGPNSGSPHPDNLRTVLIVIRNPATDQFLAYRLNHGRGWWLPAGPALSAESVEDAAHRHTLTKTGLSIKIVGLLRIEQDVARGKLRIVLLAQPRVTNNDHHEDAQWMTLPQLQEFHARGRPPWPNGTLGLGGTELLDWGRYLANRGVVCPLYILADRGDPVWTPGPVERAQLDPALNFLGASNNNNNNNINNNTNNNSSSNNAAPTSTTLSSASKASNNNSSNNSQQQQLNGNNNNNNSNNNPQQSRPAVKLLMENGGADHTTDDTADDDSTLNINGNSKNNNNNNTPITTTTINNNNNSTSSSSRDISLTPTTTPTTTTPATTTTTTPATTTTTPATNATVPQTKDRRIHFTDETPISFETYNKEEYERALDPGEGLSSLADLFKKNNDEMAQEQEQEVKDSVRTLRIRGFFIERGQYDSFGIEITHIPRGTPQSPDLTFSEAVIIKALAPNGAAAHDGRLQVGDRIVILNSQWILCQGHCAFLLSALDEATAIDLTVTRKEPLPPPLVFANLSNTELEAEAFAHAGLRVRVGDGSDPLAWTRDQVATAIQDRFSGPLVVAPAPTTSSTTSANTTNNTANNTAALISAGSSTATDTDSGAPTSADSITLQDTTALTRTTQKAKKKVEFAVTNPAPFETFPKDDYERALDPGDGLHHLGELFQKNNQEMSAEQEQEVKDSVQNIRLRGFYIERGSSTSFGVSIAHIPRYTEGSPGLMFSEVVYVSALDPEGAVAKDGRLKVGDRIVILNSQWILCLSHAKFLLQALADAPAIDVTITRNEPLPPLPSVSAMTDEELEQAAFEHGGLRVRIGPEWDPVCWAREQVLAALLPRFAASVGGHSIEGREGDEEA